MQLKQRIPAIPETLRRRAARGVTQAADWAVRTQVRDQWPAWDANKGRFPYHILIDPAQRARHPQMWSTCWKTSRAAQGLYCAHLLTGRPEYLESANRAMDYVATLQIFDPGLEAYRGAFRENSPLGPHTATRDGIEAAQGFLAGYLVTKNERYLRRAVEGAEFLLRAMKLGWWPISLTWPLEDRRQGKDYFFQNVAALVFAQLYALTGERRYLTRGVVPLADNLLKHVRPDGALGVTDATHSSHHIIATPGRQLTGVYMNDDGVAVTLLAAYAVTRKAKYRDAALGSADHWARITEPLPLFAAPAAVSLLLADAYRLTGDARYLPKLRELTERTLDLQCQSRDPFIRGCFIGEDMATIYDKRSKPADYVDLRITSYALIALSKVAAHKSAQWGCAYSCFGW